MKDGAKLALVRRMVGKVSAHYNLGAVRVSIDEALGEDINAHASQCSRDIGISRGALHLPTRLVLAIIAHELGHLICRHSRPGHIQEYEADWEAVEVLEILGFSASSLNEALASLLEKALKGEDNESACHPDMKSRFQNIQAIIKEKRGV